MKLKKNDRIILIVGVVILIAAGAGIALYTVEDDDVEVTEDTGLYSYSWMKGTGQKTLVSNEYVSSGESFEKTESITSPANTVLTSVMLELNWQDDNTYGLLNKNKGADTLIAEISQNGNMKSSTTEQMGNETMNFMIHSQPKADSIRANSKSDAQDLIDELISGENQATFDITVSVNTGEKIWRLLNYMRDKGNEFELLASYTYYSYEFDDIDDSSDDIKETGDTDFGHAIGEYYINMGYGRGMI